MSADTRVAEWREQAEEIDSTEARKHLTITDVCSRTGLKQVTLQFAINRTGTMRPDNPRAHLVRPKYRVGETPIWAAEQVDAYHRAYREQVQRREKKWADLPVYSDTEAGRRKLLTLRGISRATGYALTTLHRWSHQEGFPPAIARGASNGPNPHLLRKWVAVRDWLRQRNPDRDIPDDPPTT